jgi:hypothetical protein
MPREDQLATLRNDLQVLLGRTDIGSRRAFGQGLGWKSGEEMVRLFLAGKTDIPLGKAAEWAERCGAELRAVPKGDPWAALDLAIAHLPKGEVSLKRHLRALLRSDRPQAPPRESRQAASSSR